MIRRSLPALALLLAFTVPSPAQSIKLPATLVVPAPGLVVIVPDSVEADDVAWVSMDDGLQLIPTSLLKDSKTACGVALIAKTYRVRAIATKAKDGKAVFSPWSECVVTVGTPGPTPGPGPVPPGPTPPTPEPPSPAPIPAAGFRVLIVLESADATKLPTAQHTILFGKTVRDYLNAKCATGPDGKTKEWRIWDKDVATDAESKLWQDAMKRPHPQLPWVVISNGKAGYEGPLPANPDAMMTLLKKYAEN